MVLVDTLSFLFQLSFSTFGKAGYFHHRLNHTLVYLLQESMTELVNIHKLHNQKNNQYAIGASHSPMQCISCMQDYSTEGMSENQLRILQHLREFGLVYQRKVHIYNTIY